MIAYRIVDEVAEGFLDLIDDLQDEIDELEDHVEEWTNEQIRRRLSDLRHDLLHIRRTLAPTRDAVRRVVDNRVEIDGAGAVPPRGRTPLRRRVRQDAARVGRVSSRRATSSRASATTTRPRSPTTRTT